MGKLLSLSKIRSSPNISLIMVKLLIAERLLEEEEQITKWLVFGMEFIDLLLFV